jgi:hypothetical protein
MQQDNNNDRDTHKDNLQRTLRKLRETQRDVERKIINVEVKIRLLDYTYPAATTNNIFSSTDQSESDHIDDFASTNKRAFGDSTETSPNESDNDSTNSSLSGTNVKKGDQLRILNPGPNQEVEATVIGLTGGGNIKLRTPNGTTTYRQPHNLLIEREASSSDSDSDDNGTTNGGNTTSNNTANNTTTSHAARARTPLTHDSDNDEPPTDYILTGSLIKLGSIVRIANPNVAQQRQGIVIGTTPSGKIKVQTANGDTLHRVPDNLILLRDS